MVSLFIEQYYYFVIHLLSLRYCIICLDDSKAKINGPAVREFNTRTLEKHERDIRHLELQRDSTTTDIRTSINEGMKKEIERFKLCTSSAYIVAKSNSSYEHYETLMLEKKCLLLEMPTSNSGKERLISADFVMLQQRAIAP